MKQAVTTTDKRTIIIPALLFLALTAFLFAAFGHLNKKRAEEMNLAYLKDNTGRTASDIAEAVTGGLGEIKSMGGLLSDTDLSREAVSEHLKTLRDNSDFDYLEYASADGTRLASPGHKPGEAGSGYIARGLEGKTGVLTEFKSAGNPSDLMVFYAPVVSGDAVTGAIAGVYMVQNRPARLLQTEYYGKPAISYLCADDGRIIAVSKGVPASGGLYIFKLTGNAGLRKKMSDALAAGETVTFFLDRSATGGCLTKLPGHPFYLLQIFPSEAGAALISQTNRLVFWLILCLTLLFAALILHFMAFMRKSRKALSEALSAAKAASDAKSVFLFNMSHDIRTPMNAILGFADKALKNAGDREIVTNSLIKVKQSGSYLMSAMNEILDMARIESGETAPVFSVCLLEECVGQVFDEYASHAEEKGLEYSRDLSQISDNYVFADAAKLKQIVGHVLSNAVKYTPAGGSVRFEARRQEGFRMGYGKYVFSVKDSGQGMSPEFVNLIFESFEKEKTSTETGKPGAGLGMAIVKKLVDMLEGSIDIKSQKDAGTEVVITFELPLADKEEYVKFRGPEAEPVSEDPLKGKRVLVVEDNDLNREISCDILAEKGLAADSAEDGAAAVELLRRKGVHSYDFILMDIQMPNMNGYQATKVIRRLPNGEKVPIIAVSANAFDEDVQRSLESGMNAHIAKPIDVEQLIRTMKDLL